MSEPFKVTKIEFDKPIVICENERLVVVFQNKLDGMVCNCVHIDADGKQTIIGENVEEVVEPNDNQGETPGEAEATGSGSGSPKEEV